MATSEQLRANISQHVPKNIKSKMDDKVVYKAMEKVKNYLLNRFKELSSFSEYTLEIKKNISFKEMIILIKEKKIRKNFDSNFDNRTIKPDGGFLILKSNKNDNYKKILLVAEVKRQGTNKERVKEGKPKQAIGNAIERLGKNLIGIRAMLNYESITPFVFFGWGSDFIDDYIISKICMMNDFYQHNKTYIWKRDGNFHFNNFAPVSMYLQEEQWKVEEMVKVMKEIAETALRYYLF